MSDKIVRKTTASRLLAQYCFACGTSFHDAAELTTHECQRPGSASAESSGGHQGELLTIRISAGNDSPLPPEEVLSHETSARHSMSNTCAPVVNSGNSACSRNLPVWPNATKPTSYGHHSASVAATCEQPSTAPAGGPSIGLIDYRPQPTSSRKQIGEFEKATVTGHGHPAAASKSGGVSSSSSSNSSNAVPNSVPTKIVFPSPAFENTLPCSLCDKSFSRKYSLDRHMRFHEDERRHECEVCGLRFREHYRLLEHGRRHSGDRPHKCDECSASFIRKSNLVAHLCKEHDARRPFKCDLCGNSFVRQDHLDRHALSHAGHKKLECEECKKLFSSRSSLTRHARISCTGAAPAITAPATTTTTTNTGTSTTTNTGISTTTTTTTTNTAGNQ